MKIRNIDGLTAEDLQQEEQKGARFIYFDYTVSLLVITFKRTSGVYMVRQGEKVQARAWPFTLITMLFGWWGIPYGPRYSWQSILSNLRGGKDVTEEVMATVAGHLLFREAEKKKAARHQLTNLNS